MAQMVGRSGQVIASDLQEGMLQKLRDIAHLPSLSHQLQDLKVSCYFEKGVNVLRV
jgi:hypothetical protein